MEFVQKLTSTRAGTVALASLAAVIAGVAIISYLHNYRRSVSAAGAPVTVLVAKHTISKGTPGAAIATSGLVTSTTIRESQLREGAFSDPASLRGQVATREIYQGQQLTAADFTAGGSSLASSLSSDQRLITLPIDAAHGMIGQVQAGDRVDVFAGFNVIPVGPNGLPAGNGQARPMLRLIMQNLFVAGVGGKGSSGIGNTGSNSGDVTLRASDAQAEQLAFASDNGKLWIVLRPATGATLAKPGLVTVETMLLGVPPITILHSLGGHS
jgi:Flp pilus assembly protein CpaB